MHKVKCLLEKQVRNFYPVAPVPAVQVQVLYWNCSVRYRTLTCTSMRIYVEQLDERAAPLCSTGVYQYRTPGTVLEGHAETHLYSWYKATQIST